MRFKCLVLVALFTTAIAFAQSRPYEVIWLDFDMKNIQEPKERNLREFTVYFESLVTSQMKQATDVGRWGRKIIGKPKPASNVNELDEVPDSSWYTNRHHLRRMTHEELARGPNQGPGPDFSEVVITNAKTDGVTPGFQLKDKNGDSYLVKLDRKDYPELQSGAEIVSTKLLYAAGYNVPENYVAYLDLNDVQIDKDLQVSGKAFTREELDRLLERTARMSDGRYRVMASKILKGKPKGPFPQIGVRHDDPNDLIPHEHRRELRGLRVIASWINHWDMKETNSLDMYVEENGRHFLRHYLIDLGSTLGGAQAPLNNFHGKEYSLDIGNIFKEVATGGFWTGPSERSITAFSPAVGIFRAADFNPGNWKPSVNVIAFENMTDQDAAWATRIVMSFTEPELRSIIETAKYSDRRDSEYLVKTLLERQRLIADYWLDKVSPLSDFSVKSVGDGVELRFRDLAGSTSPEYTYQIKGQKFASNKHTTRQTTIKVSHDELRSAFAKNADASAPVEIVLWSRRPNGDRGDPVRVSVYNAMTPNVRLGHIVRG